MKIVFGPFSKKGQIFDLNMSFMSYSTRVELRNCRRTLFTIFWLGISYRGDPNRKQSILAQKSQQVIVIMIKSDLPKRIVTTVYTVVTVLLGESDVSSEWPLINQNVCKPNMKSPQPFHWGATLLFNRSCTFTAHNAFSFPGHENFYLPYILI